MKKSVMLRITLDTNVLVSSIICLGNSHEIIRLAKRGNVRLFISMDILLELVFVLKRKKFSLQRDQIQARFEELLGIVEIVAPTMEIEAVHADASDNKILECAVASNSNYIVSGDHHLLDLKEYRGAHIVTPREFL